MIKGSGKASINAYVNGKSGVSYTYVRATLQKQISSGWQEVESWKTSCNGSSAAIAESYQVSKGTYRVLGIHTGASNDGVTRYFTKANEVNAALGTSRY